MKKLSDLSANQIMAGVYVFLLLVFLLLILSSCEPKKTHMITVTYVVYYSDAIVDTVTASYECYEVTRPGVYSDRGTNYLKLVNTGFRSPDYVVLTSAPIKILSWHIDNMQ